MADELKFEVGSMYENMKGAYEVISLQRDSMVIRWDNGTEITTSVDLQRRIIERMAFEKEQQLQKDSKGPKKSQRSKKGGGSFVGFLPKLISSLQVKLHPGATEVIWEVVLVS